MQKRIAGFALLFAALAGYFVWREFPAPEQPLVELDAPPDVALFPAGIQPVEAAQSARQEAAGVAAARSPIPAEAERFPTTRTPMHLRIVDAATNCVIAGASIERSAEEKPDLESDGAGCCVLDFALTSSFKLPADGKDSLPRGFCRVHAPGYGIAEFHECEGHESEELALQLRLRRTATLVVTLTGHSKPTTNAYLVSAVAAADKLLLNDVPSGIESDSGAVSFIGACDGAGILRLEDLPARVPLKLTVLQWTRSVRVLPDSMELASGEERSIEIDLDAGCRVHGRVLDAAGAATGQVEVWIAARSDDNQARFDAHDAGDRIGFARSNGSGAFELGTLAAGSYVVGLAPERGDQPSKYVSPNVVIEIAEGEKVKEVELRAQAGLSIRGVVVQPDGTRLCGLQAQVWARTRGHAAHCFTAADGTFVLEPLFAEQYTLQVSGVGRFAESVEVETAAGDSGVVIALREMAGTIVRVVGVHGGPPLRADVLIVDLDTLQTSKMSVGRMGILDLMPAQRGLMSVTATTTDGRVGVIPLFYTRPTAQAGDLEVLLAPGAKLRVRCANDAQIGFVYVRQGEAVVACPQLESSGAATAIVPAGELTVTIRLDGIVGEHEQHVTVSAGEDREVVFDFELRSRRVR